MENAQRAPSLMKVELKHRVGDEGDERRTGIVKGSKSSRRDDFALGMSRARSRLPVDNTCRFFFAAGDESG